MLKTYLEMVLPKQLCSHIIYLLFILYKNLILLKHELNLGWHFVQIARSWIELDIFPGSQEIRECDRAPAAICMSNANPR